MVRRINKRKISVDRKRKKRATKNKIIIAVEGNSQKNKTEKLYFRNFDTGKEKYSIDIAKGNDTDPLKLIKSLIDEIQRLELDLDNGDKAYCIFDVDTNQNKDKIIKEVKKIAKKHNIEIITSTPSVELWFLLHYEYTTSYMDNSQLIKRLKKFNPKYTKTTNIYTNIKDKVKTAITRAKRLEKYHIGNERKIGFVEANPNTEMYKIVDYLIKNK